MRKPLTSLALAALVSCTPPLPRAEEAPVAPVPESVAAATPPGMDDDPPLPFVLLPGDVLQAGFVGSDAPTQRLLVDDSGLVQAPLFGSVAVGGLSLAGARARLTAAARRFDRFAELSVSIDDAGGHRVTVVGAVQKPGIFAAAPGLRLSSLVAQAGGVSTRAEEDGLVELSDTEAARLVRAGRTLPVSLPRALTGDLRHDVRVTAGDLLFVPASRRATITVLGFVKKAANLPYRRGLTMLQALAAAGGLERSADRRDLRVVRGKLSAPTVYRFDVSRVTDGQVADLALEPGDIVWVTEHWFDSSTTFLQRLTPLIAGVALGAALGAQ